MQCWRSWPRRPGRDDMAITLRPEEIEAIPGLPAALSALAEFNEQRAQRCGYGTTAQQNHLARASLLWREAHRLEEEIHLNRCGP